MPNPGQVAITLPVEDGLPAADYVARRVVLQYAMVPTHQASFRGVFPALDETAAAWRSGDRRAALRLVGDDTVHALCAIGGPGTVADYVRALRAAGIDLPVVLTPGAVPGDVAGSRATITGLADALGLPARPARS